MWIGLSKRILVFAFKIILLVLSIGFLSFKLFIDLIDMII
jgi:hypothetical protein